MVKVHIHYRREQGSLFKLSLQYSFSQQSSIHLRAPLLQLPLKSLALYFGNPQWWQSLYLKGIVHVFVTIAKS